MQELKFEVSIPAEQVENLLRRAIIHELELNTKEIKVKLIDGFIPSCGLEGPLKLNPVNSTEEYIWEEKEKQKTIADVFKESMTQISKTLIEPRKEHWTKKLESSLLTKLIAFKCDCGHITWRLCRDGDFSCECNNCKKIHKWDVLELYRLEYSCKCGYKKYLYMPLSHKIGELKCGGCKAPIDITFNSKAKRFEQIK
ncbi:hypothetical protein [uncultured Tissierella sp.]|uniref:hypothetical protein n=1 Tax=uncultured Tissierella sp. TaxID=448160 RepID=UPI002804B9B6|nr:hypothetical protein [uncultured Tissierella sp.]MDU5080260.1 hypothetical protein [Bacillota bacterium]